MPTWVAVILWAGGILTAVTTFWAKVVRPGAKVIAATENLIPLLPVLKQMAQDFQVEGLRPTIEDMQGDIKEIKASVKRLERRVP